MAEPLQYGNVGAPYYMSHERSWHFPRGLAKLYQLSYTGVTKTVVPGSSHTVSNSNGKAKPQANRLFKQNPELSAAVSTQGPERLSRNISSSGELLDAHSSTLLGFGNALDIENHSASRWIPIAASLSGKVGDILSLYRIEDETIVLNSSEKIRIPMIGNDETAFWNGPSPIRQVQFAQHVSEPSEWLAVRFLSTTVVFRPLYRRYRTSNFQKDDEGFVLPTGLPPSRLDPNPMAEVPVSGESKHLHTHVTFNPWYQKQFAVIDEGGHWAIWNITKRTLKSALDCLQSGSLPLSDNGSTSMVPYDGWATIEWVSAFNQILACNRRYAVLYHIDGETLRSQSVDLKMERRSEWILDMKRDSSNPSHIFILTTLRVLLLNVHSQSVLSSNISQVPIYSLPFTWYHFRDAEDLTLKSALLSMRDGASLLIYSRLNDLILELRAPVTLEENISLLSGHDFQAVPILDSDSNSSTFEYDTTSSSLLTLALKEIDQQALMASKEAPVLKSKLIKLFRLNSNSEIQESLYTMGPTVDDKLAEDLQPLPPFILRLRKRNYRVARDKKKTSEVVNNFVVKDTDVPSFAMPRVPFTESDNPPISNRHRPLWTVDLTAAYSLATGHIGLSRRGKLIEPPATHTFITSMEALEKEVSQCLSNSSYSTTMLEIIRSQPVLDDLHRSSEAFRRFQDKFCSNSVAPNEQLIRLISPEIGTKSVQGLITKAKAASLTGLYDRIITQWLYPLPNDIPIRTRTFKEQTIRQLVGEISLAGMHRFRTPLKSNIIELIPNFEENDTHPPQSDRNQETVLLSSSDRTGGLPSTLSENRKDRQENRGRLISDVGFSILPSLSQTKSHLIFRKGINNVLSHWSLGMDPSSYDWSQTTIEEDVRRSQESTGNSRRRSKSGRSQSKIPEDRPKLIRTSAIVPIIQQWEPYSQGGRELPVIQSSQATDDNLPMTQIERGAFGGRDATKKSTIKARKKKRAAGF